MLLLERLVDQVVTHPALDVDTAVSLLDVSAPDGPDRTRSARRAGGLASGRPARRPANPGDRGAGGSPASCSTCSLAEPRVHMSAWAQRAVPSSPATIVAASAIRWSFAQGGPSVARGPSSISSARSAEDARPLGPPRPWRRRGGRPSRVRVRSSASTWRYMTESARASYGTRRWTAMSSGKSSGQARSDIETIGSGTRWRARPATLTSLAPPTPAPARPAPRRRRRRAACLRGGSVRSPCRVRSARSAGGPRPRGRPTP